MNAGLDIAAVWAQGDTVARAVAIALLVMSVASWSIMLGKAWLVWRLRRKMPRILEQFWDSATIEAGLEKLTQVAPLHDMAHQGENAIRHLESHRHEQTHLDAHLSASELVTRALRNSIARSTA
ncbi:MAG: MotA/TolQ/ExbB proton channel family protein, partial [Azoarcus sp.]|nr:MotA/TolQ/ExbB proton channel family protein [Azoarcus sp.]